MKLFSDISDKVKKRRAFSWLASEVGTHTAIAVIAGIVVYVLVSSGYKRHIESLESRINEMEAAERSALITKRISEQMEDIAYEQKALSDKQRERAEEQSRRADIERGKAELERSLAVKAEQQARASAKQAENMRKIAEQQSELAVQHMVEAQDARAQADTLFYQSLARSLAQTSINQYKAGEKDLAALLAYSAWYYTDTYNGNIYHQDIYTSLLENAQRAKMHIGRIMGNPRAMANFSNNGDKGFLIVTDYGEIYRFTKSDDNENGYIQERMFSNNDYLFRDVCIIGNEVLALDVEGMLVKTTINNTILLEKRKRKNPPENNRLAAPSEEEVSLLFLPMRNMPRERWRHLLQLEDGNLVAVGEHQIVWLDPKGEKIIRTASLGDVITEAGVFEDILCIFTKGGDLVGYRDGLIIGEGKISLPHDNPVSYYYYHKGKELHILGTENGDVLLYDKNKKYVTSLVGHSGAITHMDHLGWCFATSSYDHKICLWNLDDIDSQIAPIQVIYDKWPLCFTTDEKSWELCIGLAEGSIEALRISVEDNRRSIHQHLEREFTPQEWEYYMGKGVKYRRFKE